MAKSTSSSGHNINIINISCYLLIDVPIDHGTLQLSLSPPPDASTPVPAVVEADRHKKYLPHLIRNESLSISCIFAPQSSVLHQSTSPEYNRGWHSIFQLESTTRRPPATKAGSVMVKVVILHPRGLFADRYLAPYYSSKVLTDYYTLRTKYIFYSRVSNQPERRIADKHMPFPLLFSHCPLPYYRISSSTSYAAQARMIISKV